MEEGQPFGYTAYRYDNISSTYFAQAREYKLESGKFTAYEIDALTSLSFALGEN